MNENLENPTEKRRVRNLNTKLWTRPKWGSVRVLPSDLKKEKGYVIGVECSSCQFTIPFKNRSDIPDVCPNCKK